MQKQRTIIGNNPLTLEKDKKLPLIPQKNKPKNSKYIMNSLKLTSLKYINFNDFLDTTKQFPLNSSQSKITPPIFDKTKKSSSIIGDRDYAAKAISYSRAIEDLNDRNKNFNVSIDSQSNNNTSKTHERILKLWQKSASLPNLTDKISNISSSKMTSNEFLPSNSLFNPIIMSPKSHIKQQRLSVRSLNESLDLSIESKGKEHQFVTMENPDNLSSVISNKRPFSSSPKKMLSSTFKLSAIQKNQVNIGHLADNKKFKSIKNCFGYNGIHKKPLGNSSGSILEILRKIDGINIGFTNNNVNESMLKDVYGRNSHDLLAKKINGMRSNSVISHY